MSGVAACTLEFRPALGPRPAPAARLRDGFTPDDFLQCAAHASIARARATAICHEVAAAVSRWSEYAEQANVAAARRDGIAGTLRHSLFRQA